MHTYGRSRRAARDCECASRVDYRSAKPGARRDRLHVRRSRDSCTRDADLLYLMGTDERGKGRLRSTRPLELSYRCGRHAGELHSKRGGSERGRRSDHVAEPVPALVLSSISPPEGMSASKARPPAPLTCHNSSPVPTRSRLRSNGPRSAPRSARIDSTRRAHRCVHRLDDCLRALLAEAGP